MRKKINKIINSGKEKIKRKKIEIGMLALINTVIGFNVNAEPLNLPKEYSENISIDEGIEISSIKEIIIGYTDIFGKNYYYNKFENENGKFNQVGECAIFNQNRTEKNKVKISNERNKND